MWSDVDWCGINSQGGVVGASAFVVAHMAVAVGWPLLWVIDRDPLRWALLLHAWLLGDSWDMAFINCGKFISIHLYTTVVMKTSSVKLMSGSITHQSSNTLCQMERLTGDWQLGLLHQVLKGLCICKGLPWLHKLVVLTAKPCV